MTSDATREARINNITNKASRTLCLLRRTLEIGRFFTGKDRAYKAFVRPVPQCESSVWDPNNVVLIKGLETIRRKAARWTIQEVQEDIKRQ